MQYKLCESRGRVEVRRIGFDNKTLKPIPFVLDDYELSQDLAIGDIVLSYFRIDMSLDLKMNKDVSVGVCAGKMIRPLQKDTPLINHPINPKDVLASIKSNYPEFIQWIKYETNEIPVITESH